MKPLDAAALLPHPEDRLLVEVASGAMRKENVDALLADNEFNWKWFTDSIQDHGLMLASLLNLRKATGNRFPPALEATLTFAQQRVGLFNLQIVNEIIRIYKATAQKGIVSLPYKGMCLAYVAYEEPLTRTATDIDILLKSSQIAQAKTITLGLGYSVFRHTEHKQYQHEDQDRSFQGYNLFRNDGVIAVDLQEQFGVRYSSFHLPFEHLWERRQQIKLADTLVPTFSAEDYMLVLSAHGVQHRWMRLRWLVDVAELLRSHPDMDWDYIIAQAQQMQVTRMIVLALALVQLCFEAELPAPANALIEADARIIPLARLTLQWMFRPVKSGADLRERTSYEFSFDWQVREQLSNKFRNSLFVVNRRLRRHVSKPETQ